MVGNAKFSGNFVLDTGTSFITIPQSLFMVFLKEVTTTRTRTKVKNADGTVAYKYESHESDCILAIELNLWLCPCKYGGYGSSS